MLDPHELRELGRERQRVLIAWRENRRLLDQLPPLEPAVITILRQVITAIISKLKSLGQARAAVPTDATRIRRGIR